MLFPILILQSIILAAVVYATMFRRAEQSRPAASTDDDTRVSGRAESGALPALSRRPVDLEVDSSTSTTPRRPRSDVDSEVKSSTRRPRFADPESDTSTTPPRPRFADPESDTSTTPRRPRFVDPESDTSTTPRRPRFVDSELDTRSPPAWEPLADLDTDDVQDDEVVARLFIESTGRSRSDTNRQPVSPIVASSAEPATPARGAPEAHSLSQPRKRQHIPQALPTPSPTPPQPSPAHSGRDFPATSFDLSPLTPPSHPVVVAPEAKTPALVSVQHRHLPTVPPGLVPSASSTESASTHQAIGMQILPKARTRAAAKNRQPTSRSISAPTTRSLSGVQGVPSSSISHLVAVPQHAATTIASHPVAPSETSPFSSLSLRSLSPGIPKDSAQEPEFVLDRHFRAFKGMAGVIGNNGQPLGTHWFASQSGYPIILPPSFSATPGVLLGDVYQHHTPFGDQLWVCDASSSGLWYWKPFQEGTRRADGRKLTITKTCKEPSWVL